MSIHDQEPFQARFEWGAEGARVLGAASRTVIIVDLLSFSTAVEVAVSRGAIVYPRRWRAGVSREIAGRAGAVATVRRSATSMSHPFSLSPRSMMNARRGMRLIVASPNGAHAALAAARSGATVLAGCFRNATACAKAAMRIGKPIAVIAAGEQWSPGAGLRPCFEDLIGAGAILAAMRKLSMSPEATAAVAAFRSASRNLLGALSRCSSGRELIARGFRSDVVWAARLDVSAVVPIMRGRVFERFAPERSATESSGSA